MPIKHSIRCVGCHSKTLAFNIFHIGSSVGGPSYNQVEALPNPEDDYPAVGVVVIDDSAMLVVPENGMPKQVQSLIHEVTAKYCPPGMSKVSKKMARSVYFELFIRIAEMVDDGTLKKQDGKWVMVEKSVTNEVLQ